jgi:hypothetical protein
MPTPRHAPAEAYTHTQAGTHTYAPTPTSVWAGALTPPLPLPLALALHLPSRLRREYWPTPIDVVMEAERGLGRGAASGVTAVAQTQPRTFPMFMRTLDKVRVCAVLCVWEGGCASGASECTDVWRLCLGVHVGQTLLFVQ